MPVQRSSDDRRRLLLRGAVALVGLLALSACYSYVPMVGETPAPGEDVRVRLSQTRSVELSERTGHPIRSLEGKVFRVAPDTLVLDVGWGSIYEGTLLAGRRDTLAFHQPDLLEVDRRELSRGRTALLGAGLAAAVVLIVRGLSGGGSGDGPGNGNGSPF